MCQAILAVDENDGIGYKGTLPWGKNQEDLQNFKKITLNHSVLMGRGTWDSKMPTPLPNRKNYVVTSNPKSINHDEAHPVSFEQACALADSQDVFLIGGTMLFDSLWSKVTHAHITMIDGKYTADTIFPLVQKLRGFRIEDVQELNTYSTYYLFHRVQ